MNKVVRSAARVKGHAQVRRGDEEFRVHIFPATPAGRLLARLERLMLKYRRVF